MAGYLDALNQCSEALRVLEGGAVPESGTERGDFQRVLEAIWARVAVKLDEWPPSGRDETRPLVGASEARFRQIFETAPVPFALFTVDHPDFVFNRRFEELFGYTRADIATVADWYRLAYPDPTYRALVIEESREKFDSSGMAPMHLIPPLERKVTCKDGRVLTGFMSGSRFGDTIMATFLDTTHQRRAEAERASFQAQLAQSTKMEALGRLAGGVAHDFNNLLTAIQGNLQLVRLDPTDTTATRQLIDDTLRAVQSATTVIQQLHTFSRKQVLAARVIDLNPLCERVRGMLTRLIDAGIRVEAELTDALGHVRVDPALFEQVIINVAINARDAMPGGGRLTLSTANAALDEAAARARSLPAGDFVVLTVKDTGVGMSPEVQAHLFEPFFTTKPAGDGSGLGLAACHGVVQQAGGAIGVESELGKGTTFRIFLPRVYDAVEREREEVARAGASPPRGSETILFVEDEPLIRGPVARLLNRLGYRVLIASSGEEAMRLAERFGPIALLFTDIVMPGMGGVELSSLLSAASPGLKTLFTSGYAPESITGDGGLDVRKSFIGKPYSLPVLAERLRSLLDARQTG